MTRVSQSLPLMGEHTLQKGVFAHDGQDADPALTALGAESAQTSRRGSALQSPVVALEGRVVVTHGGRPPPGAYVAALTGGRRTAGWRPCGRDGRWPGSTP